MPRIRTVKPEFYQDEKLAPCEPIVRLVFLGLISMADDAGRLLDNVKAIDGFIFPVSSHTSRESLEILMRLSRILRYRSASGQPLIQIINWPKHQAVPHPSRYVLPAPTESDFLQVVKSQKVKRGLMKHSGNSHENGVSVSGDVHAPIPDPRSPIPDHGPTTNDQHTSDVQKVFEHWLRATHRNAAKTKLTPERKAKIEARIKAGYGVDDLILAIDGLMLSDFHAGKPEYTDLTSCFGNDTKVEQHMQRATDGVAPDDDDAWIAKTQAEMI